MVRHPTIPRLRPIGLFSHYSPVADERAEVVREALVGRQHGRVLLQHAGQHLEVVLAVLVRKRAGGQLNLAATKQHT